MEGQQTSVGVVSSRTGTALTTHPLVTKLQAAGAAVVGAAKLDALALSGPYQTASCKNSGNPGYPGRCLLGGAGAAAVVVASGKADLALGNDVGAEMLLAAACTGLCAFRATHATVDLSTMLRASDSIDCAAFITHDAASLPKVRVHHSGCCVTALGARSSLRMLCRCPRCPSPGSPPRRRVPLCSQVS